MSNDRILGEMAVTIAKLQEEIASLRRQIGNVSETWVHNLRHTDVATSGSGITHALIKNMYLLEIIRSHGMLDDVDMDAIDAKVRDHFEGRRLWGSTNTAAEAALTQARREIAGDYSTD